MEEQKKREERWKIIKAVTGERKEKEVWLTIKEENSHREKKAIEKELEEKKAELIKICEENQEVFEQVSDELLNKLELDGKPREGVTSYTIEDYVSQIQNPEWDKLAGTFSPFYPVDESKSEGTIRYYYWSGGRFVLRVQYIRKDENEMLEYLYCRYRREKNFIKINEHLYVCIDESCGV